MMIASLNIVTKTFAKIAKMFVALSATIIATRRRPILILHLEEKYTKNGVQKWNLRKKKKGKEHLDYKKSTLKKSTVKPGQSQQSIESQRLTENNQQRTSASWLGDDVSRKKMTSVTTWKMTLTRADVEEWCQQWRQGV